LSDLLTAAIVGYGSIGRRHHQVLTQMGWSCQIVSQHYSGENSFKDLSSFFSSEKEPKLIIIASPTHLHESQLRNCLNRTTQTCILVEKPLGFRDIPNSNRVWVGYNLRFHPLVEKLSEVCLREKLMSLSIDIRRYLPSMRGAKVDYQKSYSCFSQLGGGVLRDFAHDLDLPQHLTGSWLDCHAQGGKFGELYGDAMDTCSLIGKKKYCPHIQVHMTYLDPMPTRRVRLVTDERSIEVDLDSGKWVDSLGTQFQVEGGLEQSYVQQIHGIQTSSPQLCTLSQALEIENMIYTIESND
jgi:predicted dehydrogenase